MQKMKKAVLSNLNGIQYYLIPRLFSSKHHQSYLNSNYKTIYNDFGCLLDANANNRIASR